VLSLSLTVADTPESFNASSFESALLRLFPAVESVTLTLSGGSLVVVARLVLPNATAADAAATNVVAMTLPQLSSALGVSVQTVATPTVAIEPYVPYVAPPEAVVCCAAVTLTCLACADGLNVSAYCARYPATDGCGGPAAVPAALGESRTYRAHRMHGVLMTVAFGLLFPAAVAMPLAWRRAAPTRWMRAHKALNLAGAAVTVAGVLVASESMNADGASSLHFDGTHRMLGLLLSIVVVVQILAGFLRPPKAPAASTADQAKVTPTPAPATEQTISSKRKVWKYVHMAFGYGILGLALAQLASGVELSKKITAEGPLEWLYGLHGGLIGAAIAWALLGWYLGRAGAGDDVPYKA
jgi:hypothetical protein